MVHIRFRFVLFLTVIFAPIAPVALGQSISLTVDATQVQRKIVRTHIVMPVKPGRLSEARHTRPGLRRE